MSLPRILVTGATGRTGAVVASELIAAGYPVRAMVRVRDRRSQALEARGIEIALADMNDAEAVASALRGVQRAFWLPPYDPNMLGGAAVFATAAAEARLESVVALSQWLASPSHPSLATRQHWLADRLFALIPGLAHTIVNPGFFADTPYLSTFGYAAHFGVFPWLFGDSRTAPPSVADIGRVAAAALMDPARHGGRRYRPTGPALLTGGDMAAILGHVLGRKVRLAPTPLWAFLKAARLDSQPLALLSAMAHYGEEHRRGTFAIGAPNDDVRRVTGRAPETFETVVRRHAALPQNRRNAANFARAVFRSVLAPFVPAPPIARYLDGLHLTAPARSLYALDSAVWRSEHGLVDAPSEPMRLEVERAAAPAGRVTAS